MYYFVFFFCYGNAMYSCWDRFPPHYCFFCFRATVRTHSIFVWSEIRFLLFDNFMFLVCSLVFQRAGLWFRHFHIILSFCTFVFSLSIIPIVISVRFLLFARAVANAAFIKICYLNTKLRRRENCFGGERRLPSKLLHLIQLHQSMRWPLVSAYIFLHQQQVNITISF